MDGKKRLLKTKRLSRGLIKLATNVETLASQVKTKCKYPRKVILNQLNESWHENILPRKASLDDRLKY